ncbi:DNA-packaging protein [Brevibacillus sp. HB1.4B]|uniref:DNA-packaging protein n=1 Tax=Brevibacillus sp. HB1.4B TaxID=2738845 RepID=UPI00156BA582|nr:DNA-packaging protein [Brevibacillus sp. HB1.4B]NRS15824.1 DNA-packaging protein [Brevibacillus sp. HB1.4B]
MAILTSNELIGFYAEFASWELCRLDPVILRANVYVEGQVNIPNPVPDELKLAVAMVIKDMAQDRRLSSTKQGDYQETFSYVSNDPKVEGILKKYSKNRGQKLWMI